jgi:hypothetical protein
MKSVRSLVLLIFVLTASFAMAQQPVNNAQTAGTATLTGNGTTGAGSQRVTIASDNTAFAVNATLSAETTKVIGEVNQGTSPWVSNVSQVGGTNVLTGNGTTGAGSLRVTIASDNTAFAVNATLSAETTKVIGTVNQGTSPWVVSAGASASGGATFARFAAAATNNATNTKGSAGQLYSAEVFNNAGYPVYLKFYNKATSPAPASDNTLLGLVLGCQAGLHCYWAESAGQVYGTGIGYALVKGISDTDNTSVAANDAVVTFDYK